jgi:hypothetical protein
MRRDAPLASIASSISNRWIGDADEVQRMDDEGHLEGLIQHTKNLEYGEDPEDDGVVDYTNRTNCGPRLPRI